MGKSTSQWNFGELFPTETVRKVLSVGELTEQVRRLLEKQIGQVWVGGEVTNFRAQASGHFYFTLKDSGAQIGCVLFRNEAVPHREFIADGQKVLLQGDVTVYGARGQYQIIVRTVELQGVGGLQIAFEKLKQKLSAEGFFAPERKRPLPKYPQRIGLITSPSGAAIRDVLHVVQRRNPALEIIFAPCRVQGFGAVEEIVNAIRLLNDFGALDLILITRGGGSQEDLSAFNAESVARAIFESRAPIVSAIGHEIDFSIADFVADLRAATPSAATEIITEGVFASRQLVAGLVQRMIRIHPRRQLNAHWQRLDDLQMSLLRQAKNGARGRRIDCQNLVMRLRQMRPQQILARRRSVLQAAQKRIGELAREQFKNRKTALAAIESRLRLLGPEQVLARGYSITMDAGGNVLRDSSQVKTGQRVQTRLQSGKISSLVE